MIGLGELALGQIMPAFAEAKYARPTALVSGHPDKARRVAQAYSIDDNRIYNYDNFDRIAHDEQVDAVYIVLPNSMHCEFTLRSVASGKHVLCEKPMTTNVADARQMIASAKSAQRKLMIAYRLRYEPHHQRAIALCRDKTYGQIKTILATNCQTTKAPNIRLSRALGGGPLGDIGIYCLNACRYLTGEEPVEAWGTSYRPTDEPRFREVPARIAFALRFPSGALAHCDASFDSVESRLFRVQCAEAFLHMDSAFGYHGLQLTVRRESDRDILNIPAINHFASELDHFAECILHDQTPRTPGEEGLADLQVMAAIERSFASGHAEGVA